MKNDKSIGKCMICKTKDADFVYKDKLGDIYTDIRVCKECKDSVMIIAIKHIREQKR